MAATKKWTIMVSLCSFVVGVLLMFQLKAQANAPQDPGAENVLPKLIERNQEIVQLRADNDRLNAELQKLKEGTNAAMLADDQLKRARLLAGAVAVKGPGIRITLDDSKQPVTNPDDVGFYIIHEQYLREIVNALWNAKADAVAINNERIMADTEIFCAGNYISINKTVQTPPYVITAIGDPQKLTKGVEFYLNFTLGTYSKTYGITVKQDTVQQLEIPAGKIPTLKFAKPVKGGA